METISCRLVTPFNGGLVREFYPKKRLQFKFRNHNSNLSRSFMIQLEDFIWRERFIWVFFGGEAYSWLCTWDLGLDINTSTWWRHGCCSLWWNWYCNDDKWCLISAEKGNLDQDLATLGARAMRVGKVCEISHSWLVYLMYIWYLFIFLYNTNINIYIYMYLYWYIYIYNYMFLCFYDV